MGRAAIIVAVIAMAEIATQWATRGTTVEPIRDGQVVEWTRTA